MQKEEKNIDSLFRDQLLDFEADVPLYVWDNITEKLDGKKRIKAFYYISGIAASVLMLIAFGAGYFLTKNTQHNQQFAQHTPNKSANEMGSEPISEPTKQPENETNNVIATAQKTEIESMNTSQKQSAKTVDKQNNQLYNTFNHNTTNVKNNTIANNSTNADNELIMLNDAIMQVEYSETNTVANTVKRAKPMHVNYIQPVANFAQLNLLAAQYTKSDDEKKILPLEINENNVANTSKKSGGWSLEGQFSPLYASSEGGASYSQNEYMDNMASINVPADKADYNKNNYAAINSEMNAMPSYSGGFNVQFTSEKRWAVQSGVFYSKRNKAIEDLIVNSYVYNNQNVYYINSALDEVYFNPTAASQFDEMRQSGEIENAVSAGYNQMVYQSGLDLVQSFDYVEIPMIFKFALIDKRFGVNFIGGLSTDILVNNSISIKYDQNSLWEGAQNEAKMFNYSSTLGVGFDYALTSRISLTIEPRMRNLLSANTAKNYNFPSSFACFTGIRFNLR